MFSAAHLISADQITDAGDRLMKEIQCEMGKLSTGANNFDLLTNQYPTR